MFLCSCHLLTGSSVEGNVVTWDVGVILETVVKPCDGFIHNNIFQNYNLS
jgi:hypothetical protein